MSTKICQSTAASREVSSPQTPLQRLVNEVKSNLEHEALWSSVEIHTNSPLTGALLPRPLLSGIAPERVYVHPDDQIEELKSGRPNKAVEREWVLPTRLREKWTLRQFAEIFDGICEDPTDACVIGPVNPSDTKAGKGAQNLSSKRRGGKRLLLSIVGNDSTVVYYIVHDGLVKPRQN